MKGRKIIVVGAGLSGLIAATFFRRSGVEIIEKQSTVPNNHRALLRFRSDDIATLTNIPFRKVLVRKAVWSQNALTVEPTLQAANAYSQKVTGEIHSRSLWNLREEHRFIAPDNLVSLLAEDLRIHLDRSLSMEDLLDPDQIIVSTIPMPDLMEIVGWEPRPKFVYRPIWTVNATIETPTIDVFQTVYYPDPGNSQYRASLMGDRLIVEYNQPPQDAEEDIGAIIGHFGISDPVFSAPLSIHKQPYGKIVPVEEAVRREFIRFVTWEYGVMSLGRFATWRQILLDDLPDDLEKIALYIHAENDRREKQFSVYARSRR